MGENGSQSHSHLNSYEFSYFYGAAHDQLSYTLSPEYFTKLKAPQFWYAGALLGLFVAIGEVRRQRRAENNR